MTGARADRVFLDANVLFSAAWREGSGLLRLWALPRCRLLTSALALEEARRNLDTRDRQQRLQALLRDPEIVPEVRAEAAADECGLPPKDIPILAAAIAGGATHLLTGDLRDLGPLMERRIEGLLIQRPAGYLAGR